MMQITPRHKVNFHSDDDSHETNGLHEKRSENTANDQILTVAATVKYLR